MDSPWSEFIMKNGKMKFFIDFNGADIKYDFNMDYTIKIPFGLKLDVSTVNNGDVSISDPRSEVQASNVNGSVYLENISDAIRNGETFNIQSSRKKGFTCITFGESSRYNSYRLRSSLWGVGEHGRTPTSFRFQLDTMISAMKELQVTAGELKVHPSSERVISAHESETKFRESYNLLLSMYSWKKDNEYDGVSRAVLRSDMTALGGRIEKLLGLSSRRLGIGVAQQIHSGLDEVHSILSKVKTELDDSGREVLR